MPPASLPTPADIAGRALYAYYNRSVAGGVPGTVQDEDDVVGRMLYAYVNRGPGGHPAGGEFLDADDVLARMLYAYLNRGHDRDPSDVPLRALYDYVAYTNDEPFPWIERLVPNEQFPLGQVDIHGDGFGDTQAAEGGQVKLSTEIMGVVSWSARSPNLHPANSGIPTEKAITVTVPADGESGLVTVELTT